MLIFRSPSCSGACTEVMRLRFLSISLLALIAGIAGCGQEAGAPPPEATATPMILDEAGRPGPGESPVAGSETTLKHGADRPGPAQEHPSAASGEHPHSAGVEHPAGHAHEHPHTGPATPAASGSAGSASAGSGSPGGVPVAPSEEGEKAGSGAGSGAGGGCRCAELKPNCQCGHCVGAVPMCHCRH
jgi:hypothetical protein